MPTRSFQEILDRHRGPYSLMVWRTEGAGKALRITKQIEKTADPEQDAMMYLGDPRDFVTSVDLWSEGEGAFVTTFTKGDASFDAAAARAAYDAGDKASRLPPRRQEETCPTTTDESAKASPPSSSSKAIRPPASRSATPTTTTSPKAVQTPGASSASTASPKPATSGSSRGGKYVFVKDSEAKLGTTPALVLETFKRLGAATVAEVAAAIESSLTTDDPKGLVASHATRLKAAGLLEKEAA